jgi:cytochrome c-type biogenesis protein CcmH/NrfG
MPEKSRKQQILDMLQDEPNDPELRYMLAMEYVSEGNDAEAARTFEKLIAAAPNYAPGYHMGARTMARLNHIAEARAILERGIPIAFGQGNTHAAGEMQELLESLE